MFAVLEQLGGGDSAPDAVGSDEIGGGGLFLRSAGQSYRVAVRRYSLRKISFDGPLMRKRRSTDTLKTSSN